MFPKSFHLHSLAKDHPLFVLMRYNSEEVDRAKLTSLLFDPAERTGARDSVGDLDERDPVRVLMESCISLVETVETIDKQKVKFERMTADLELQRDRALIIFDRLAKLLVKGQRKPTVATNDVPPLDNRRSKDKRSVGRTTLVPLSHQRTADTSGGDSRPTPATIISSKSGDQATPRASSSQLPSQSAPPSYRDAWKARHEAKKRGDSCFICKQKGHWGPDCPRYRCYQCGVKQAGHYPSRCPDKIYDDDNKFDWDYDDIMDIFGDEVDNNID
jgi:hypothetical protein